MVIGVLTLEIHLPYAESLKDKRHVIRKVKDRLRARFNVAVAELDHQELWQRATLGVVTLSNDESNLEQVMQAVNAESQKILGADLVSSTMEIL